MKPFVTVLLGSLMVAGCGPALPATVMSDQSAAPQIPPVTDLSRHVGLLRPGSGKSCPFPAEADAEKLAQGTAAVQVTVGVDGAPLSASILSDSGHGFGRAAVLCVMNNRYQPARDRSGTPIVASETVYLRFAR